MDISLIGFLVTIIILFVVMGRFAHAIQHMARNPEFQLLLLATLATLASGMFFYHRFEGWSLLDSLYFSVITLTTVGYGDFAPQTNAGKVFTIMYIIAGLGILAAFITTVANIAIEQDKTHVIRRIFPSKTDKPPPPTPTQPLPPHDSDGDAHA